MKNEKYTGKYIFNKGTKKNHRIVKEDVIVIENAIPAIIDEDLFREVQKRMEKNKKQQASYTAQRIYLLSGLIECGVCGSSMVGTLSKGQYTYYRCNSKSRKKACNNKDVNKEMIEQYVIDELLQKVFSEDALPKLVERLNEENKKLISERDKEKKKLSRQYEEIKKSISSIVDVIAKGYFHPSLHEKLTELEQQKAEIEVRIKEMNSLPDTSFITEEKIRQYLLKDKEVLEAGDPHKIKQILPTYINKIIVYRDRIEAHFRLSVDDAVCAWMVAANRSQL